MPPKMPVAMKMPTETQIASMMGMPKEEIPKTFFGKVRQALKQSRLISTGLRGLSSAQQLERFKPILSGLASFAEAKGYGRRRRVGLPRKRKVVRKVGGAVRKLKSVVIRL